jgi:hypothetical protein
VVVVLLVFMIVYHTVLCVGMCVCVCVCVYVYVCMCMCMCVFSPDIGRAEAIRYDEEVQRLRYTVIRKTTSPGKVCESA